MKMQYKETEAFILSRIQFSAELDKFIVKNQDRRRN